MQVLPVKKLIKVDIFTSPHYPVERKIMRRSIQGVLDKVGIDSDIQVTISVVGDRKIRELNRKFRSKDTTTNVLSFPLHNSGKDLEDELGSGQTTTLGDIIISYPVARIEAAGEDMLVDQKIARLVVHGMLHLLGFDHEDQFEALQMEKLEDEIFDKVGL